MSARKTPAIESSMPTQSVPVATIYQNSDQVAGVLQQLFSQPLIVEETRDSNSTTGDESSITGSASAEGGAKVPFLKALSVKAAGDLAGSGSWTSTTGTAARQQFVYSQAYYLHLVRQQLAERGNLHQLRSAEDADSI